MSEFGGNYSLSNLCTLLGLDTTDLDIESVHELQGSDKISDKQFRALQIIISEIARYAMMDLSNLRDHFGKGEGIGSRTFHTRSFNDWVSNKAKAVLVPYGVHPDWIRRVSRSILNQSPRIDYPEEKEWYQEDRFYPSILYLGEMIRLGEGRNSVAPSRYIDTKGKKLIVSSMPTSWLRKNISQNEDIELKGIMRFIRRSNSVNHLQPIDEYANVPYDIRKIIDDNYSNGEHDFRKMRIDLENEIRARSSKSGGLSFKEFNQEVEIDETELQIMKWERYSSQQSWDDWGLFTGQISKMIPYRPLKIGKWGNVRFFVALPVDQSKKYDSQAGTPHRSEDFTYFRIPAEWQKYVIRIFYETAKFTKIAPNRIRLRKTPPVCGYRMINAFGAQYNRKNNQYPAHYFVDSGLEDLIRFLQHYCLYQEEKE